MRESLVCTLVRYSLRQSRSAMHADILVHRLLLPDQRRQREHLVDLISDVMQSVASINRVLLRRVQGTLGSNDELQNIDLQ